MIVVSTPCCTLNPGMERRWMLHFNRYYFLFFFLPIIFDMLEQFFIGNILIFWPFFSILLQSMIGDYRKYATGGLLLSPMNEVNTSDFVEKNCLHD